MKISDEPAKCLTILGTGSDVGKSIVVTALCRIFRALNVDVVPFKAQNMSNNSYVTVEGLEMGRAQIVQAQAARVEPLVDMNPVLLKPCSDTGAQVVVHGRPIGNSEASDYFADTDALFAKACESLDRLRRRHELVVMEGAGSCAEVNLRPRDFVNFRMAHAADAPVLLVADIDRGGVFAQIVGTLDVIPEDDRQRVAGFIINRFRGDARLFDDGIDYLQRRTNLPVLGLIPWFYHIEIDSEDGMPLDVVIDPPAGPVSGMLNIAAIRLPHISNFTDFNPLQREPGVNFHYLAKPRDLGGYDLVLLPGAKNVRSDLDWIRQTGWDLRLRRYVELGGQVGGVCGGYQMLGRIIRDPDGIEGTPGETAGLGLLDAETTLERSKTLTRTVGTWLETGDRVDGYEIHMGTTNTMGASRPVLDVHTRNARPVKDQDGMRSADGKIWGTYLHGLFDEFDFRRSFLKRLCPSLADRWGDEDAESIAAFRDRQYDLLAAHYRDHLDMRRLLDILDRAAGRPIPSLAAAR
ncbi:MAG: cobyric acid synthase [Phycisphaerae bacterium]|nr:cobyric acid synthase [Phycisphaerae bacterium]